MTNAEQERKVFWQLFEQELKRQDNPFCIKHYKYFATINKHSAISNYCLSIDFLVKKQFLRVGIYMLDNIPSYEYMCLHKEEIEDLLGFNLKWVTEGEKNPNVRRIVLHIPFIVGDDNSYRDTINIAIEHINKLIEVIPQYSPENIFD